MEDEKVGFAEISKYQIKHEMNYSQIREKSHQKSFFIPLKSPNRADDSMLIVSRIQYAFSRF